MSDSWSNAPQQGEDREETKKWEDEKEDRQKSEDKEESKKWEDDK